MKVFFVTTNRGKILTAQDVLSDYNIQSEPCKLDIQELQSSDLTKVARQKAQFAYGIIKRPLFTLDGGFWLDEDKDFPVTSIKDVIEKEGIEGILKRVEGKDKGCEFRHAVAYSDKNYTEPKIFESVIRGVVCEPRGTLQERNWSILHRIVIAEDSGKTLAEMNRDEYKRYVGYPIFSDLGKWLNKSYGL